jgi:hypothetical protein
MRASVFIVSFITHLDALAAPQIPARFAIDYDFNSGEDAWASAKCRLSQRVLGCGLLQVSDPGRFARRKALPGWLEGLRDPPQGGEGRADHPASFATIH